MIAPDYDALATVIESLAEVPVFWWDDTFLMAQEFVELTETANAQAGGDDDVRRDYDTVNDRVKTLVGGQRRMTVQVKVVSGLRGKATEIGERIRLQLAKEGPNYRLAPAGMQIANWTDFQTIPYQLDSRVVSAMTFDLFVNYAVNSAAFDEDFIETAEPDLTILP